jgi:hypothetical protein
MFLVPTLSVLSNSSVGRSSMTSVPA